MNETGKEEAATTFWLIKTDKKPDGAPGNMENSFENIPIPAISG